MAFEKPLTTGGLMKRIHSVLAKLALGYYMARIALHVLALLEGKESFVRARAGIAREFRH